VEHLPWHHRDPFDRMLVAQASIEGAAIVSRDDALRPYEVTLIW
jgi:PIN domain nuclease of toxin-antitoxin system